MNFEQFNFLECNRSIMPKHVKRLAQEIERKNLTKENPIKIDKEFNVLEGQHRLLACESMKIPVYYQFSEMTHQDIGKFNSLNEKWAYKDYLKYWSNQGVDDYKILGGFVKRYPYPISLFVYLLTGAQNNTVLGDFRNGMFKITQGLDFIEDILLKISELGKYNDVIYRHRGFIMVYAYDVMTHPDFEHKKFLHKVSVTPSLFIKQTNRKDYLRMIEEIYNRNNKHGLSLRLY